MFCLASLLLGTAAAQAQVIIKERVELGPGLAAPKHTRSMTASGNVLVLPTDGPVQVRFEKAFREVVGYQNWPTLDQRSLKVKGPSGEVVEPVGAHFRNKEAGTNVKYCNGTWYDITFKEWQEGIPGYLAW